MSQPQPPDPFYECNDGIFDLRAVVAVLQTSESGYPVVVFGGGAVTLRFTSFYTFRDVWRNYHDNAQRYINDYASSSLFRNL